MSATTREDVRLLIIEDDAELARLLREYLQQQGFVVSTAGAGDVGAARILDERPELVILDMMLPGMSGLQVCRLVRAQYKGAILMLTASQSEADHVAGLELGADDFVVKPIEPRVLLARVRTLLRRVRPAHGAPVVHGRIEVGALTIDLALGHAQVGGVDVGLTSMELDVLVMLAQQIGSVVRREDMYPAIMGVAYDGLDRGMDVHVSRIRRKLQQRGFDARRLRAVRGVGYMLVSR